MSGSNILPVAWANLRSIRHRLAAVLVLVVGTACVVGSLIALIGVGEGLTRMVGAGGSPLRALVLSRGARSELASTLSPGDVAVISAASEIARDRAGEALASADTLAIVALRTSGGNVAQAVLRGAGSRRAEIYPSLRILSGRAYRPGLREVVVGRNLLRQFPFLAVGRDITLRGTVWRVTGTFAMDGGLGENVMMTDAATAQAAAQRQGFQSVTVKLASAAAVKALRATLADNPALSVDVIAEPDYLAAAGTELRRVLDFLAYFVGVIMAGGAICSAFTIFYVTMESRRREIATFQAIGFSWSAVLAALLGEAVLIGLAGAALGGTIAYWAFDRQTVTTMGVSFDSVITVRAVLAGVLIAVVIDLLGGLVPAIRAATRPLPEMLAAR